jgi:integrase
VNRRRRKLRTTRPRPVHLDTPEQLAALLEACRLLDASPTSRTTGRLPLVATMAFAGLRVGEACALRWHDVDLAALLRQRRPRASPVLASWVARSRWGSGSASWD